jgi:hypothetical protein
MRSHLFQNTREALSAFTKMGNFFFGFDNDGHVMK